MSLLSREQIRLFLGPSELIGVRLSGWHPRVAQKCRIAIDAEANGDDWLNCGAALAAAAAELNVRRGVVTLTLSSHHTRHLVLPWDDTLANDEEELAVARHQFVSVFGAAAEHWIVGVGEQRPGLARLACAMDDALLAALQAALGKAAPSARLSVRPYLAAVFNGWCRQLGDRHTGWLVLAEPGRLCLSYMAQGCWRWVRAINVAADWAADLAALVEQESLVAGIGYLPAPVAVFDPTTRDLPWQDTAQLSVRKLQLPAIDGFSPLGDLPFGLALAG